MQSTFPEQKEPFENIDQEVDFYIKIAFEMGIDKAIDRILKEDNPYLLDKFHDQLIFDLRRQRRK